MALKIANRLSNLHAPQAKADPQKQTKEVVEAPKEKSLSRDEEYQQKFGLPTTEVVLQGERSTEDSL